MRALRLIMMVLTGGQLLLASGQTFNRRYDPFAQQYAQVAWSIDPNGDDGYAVTIAGYYDDSVYIYMAPILVRIDADGEAVSESKMIDGVNSIYPGWSNCSQRTADDGIIIGGSLRLPSDSNHAAIIKYAANGDSLWLREYGDGIGRQVKQTKDGGYILCGEHVVGNHTDAFLIKTDDLGNEEWTRSYGGGYLDYAMSIDTTVGEGYFVGGEYQVSQSNWNLWVFRVDADGDTLWDQRWGSALDEPNAHMSTLANGNPIIASAWGHAPQFAQTRFYMAELDQEDGHLVWDREYGAINSSTLFAVKEVGPGEGAIAAGGFMEPDTINFYKGVLLRTAPNGDSLWMRTYVFAADSLFNDGVGQFKDVIPTNDGGFIACGYTMGSYAGVTPPDLSQDAWVVKVDSLGCIVPGCDIPMGITTQITNLGHALSVYPNPLRRAQGDNSLHVGIQLPGSFKTEGPLSLTVVSMEGKVVRQEAVPTSLPGEVLLDVTGLAPGAYTVHLSDRTTWIAGKKFLVE